MVERYDDYDRQYHDTCSTYYEDTKLGRIFSNQYNQYNNKFVNSYFWRTYQGEEIDYIEDKNSNIYFN